MEGRRGGLGRTRFSYPPFRRQSRRLQTGSENKIIQEIIHVFRFILESMNLKLFLFDNADLQEKLANVYALTCL